MNPLPAQSTRRVAVIAGARPLRPLRRAVRHRLQPGDAHRGPRRPGRAPRTPRAGEVGEFVAGAVLKHSRDFNLARETVLGSALHPSTPAYDIQQACGTGLQAVIAAANKIALGQTGSAIAGGADTASDAPLGVNDRLRRILLEARRAKSLGGRAKALAKVRPGHLVPDIPRNAEPLTGLSMGEHAAVTARAWGVTREAQDELAATSHRRLAAAYERGFFQDLVVPFRGPVPRPEPASRLDGGATGRAEARVRSFRPRPHDDGGQLDTPDGRCGDGAAGERGVGRGARP